MIELLLSLILTLCGIPRDVFACVLTGPLAEPPAAETPAPTSPPLLLPDTALDAP
jgi:hypothetical protein